MTQEEGMQFDTPDPRDERIKFLEARVDDLLKSNNEYQERYRKAEKVINSCPCHAKKLRAGAVTPESLSGAHTPIDPFFLGKQWTPEQLKQFEANKRNAEDDGVNYEQ